MTTTPPPTPQINCTNPQNELTSLYCNITNGTIRNITKNDFNSVANLTDTIVDATVNTFKDSDVYKIGEVSTTQGKVPPCLSASYVFGYSLQYYLGTASPDMIL
uniref:Uncharacterized protein n=1 Tax=Acrobeloides nanus TaxID=290746 RepID=A0A914D992_9BILA